MIPPAAARHRMPAITQCFFFFMSCLLSVLSLYYDYNGNTWNETEKSEKYRIDSCFFEALYGVYGKIVRLHLEMYDSSINRWKQKNHFFEKRTSQTLCFMILYESTEKCRCSLMVEHNLAKVDTGVRFPSSAPVTFLFELL